MIAAIDPWAFRPHPEVWLLIAGIVGLGFYATRVIGPKVVTTPRHSRSSSADAEVVATRASHPEGDIVSRKQRRYFILGVVTLAIAADWPMHDIAEQYLYSVHMLQHLLITFFIPIFFLQATPEWLARLILGGGDQERTLVGKLAKPVVAGLIFNLLAALTHWNGIVQLSFDSGPFHYSIHLVMFCSALLMWLPVLGPLPELRLSPPAQMIYLFLMSIIPTIPAGWLTFADNPVYPAYDTIDRLWGIDVVSDQQAAGFIMKVLGGFFLWTLIAFRFFRWAASERASDMQKRVVRPLTYEDVNDEFEKAGPAPTEV
ncbi:MAG: cytochrome c oxidase assembly protein [Acidimicrobiia bacterium]|nr:cytochrome c oxidase assembly protein [Acidimicrobiia bacterium]